MCVRVHARCECACLGADPCRDGRERGDLVIRCRCGPAGHISCRRPKSTRASSNPVSEFMCGHVLLKLLLHRRHSRLLASALQRMLKAPSSAGWLCAKSSTGARQRGRPPADGPHHGGRSESEGQHAFLHRTAAIAPAPLLLLIIRHDGCSHRRGLCCCMSVLSSATVPAPSLSVRSSDGCASSCSASAFLPRARSSNPLLCARPQHAALLPASRLGCTSVHPAPWHLCDSSICSR